MSNQERAAELIWGYLECQPSCDTAGQDERQRCNDCMETAQNCAADLADAGLLAPDLPEPAIYDGLVEWDTPRGYVNVENGVIVAAYDHRAAPSVAANTLIVDDRDAARAIGHALLAAANYKEEGQ